MRRYRNKVAHYLSDLFPMDEIKLCCKAIGDRAFVLTHTVKDEPNLLLRERC